LAKQAKRRQIVISLRDVTYTYPNTEVPVLRDLSLEVEEGDFLLVIGASGAGKSTLLRCLNGLIPHFYGGVLRGELRVGGRDPIAEEPRGMSDLVGFVFQDPEAQLVVDLVEDELAFAMENHNLPQPLMRKRVEEVLDQLNIAPLRHRRVSTLSGGEKQRVAIGAVLTLQPKVLVLDEPTSQLDPQAAEEVLTTLQKLNADLGLTIVLSEHRLERVVQFVDRLLYMPGGGQPPLVGPPGEVLAQVDLCPPLIALAKELGWDPLPLTIKEGQRFARRLQFSSSTPSGERARPAGAKPRPVIQVSNLWFSYGQNGATVPREALCGVNLTVEQGEFVALMGRNGSGKTTLLKHLVGLFHPDRGHVELWGEDTRRLKTEDIVRRVGYLPQNPNALLFADTLRDELGFTRRSHGLPLGGYDELLRALELEQHIDAYPRDLSVGERQRAALAAILVAGPEVILLDEPTRGLDYPQKRALADFLAEQCRQGKTVVMSTHDVELVARCADRVVILGEGQVVVDGPARAVMTESLVFSSQINKLFRNNRFLTVEDVLEVMGK
jgi:energy-coupling factor transport system ATP-binding protein